MISILVQNEISCVSGGFDCVCTQTDIGLMGHSNEQTYHYNNPAECINQCCNVDKVNYWKLKGAGYGGSDVWGMCTPIRNSLDYVVSTAEGLSWLLVFPVLASIGIQYIRYRKL